MYVPAQSYRDVAFDFVRFYPVWDTWARSNAYTQWTKGIHFTVDKMNFLVSNRTQTCLYALVNNGTSISLQLAEARFYDSESD